MSGFYVLISNWPIIGLLLDADYRPGGHCLIGASLVLVLAGPTDIGYSVLCSFFAVLF